MTSFTPRPPRIYSPRSVPVPVVDYVRRNSPQPGDQLRVVAVDDDAAGFATEGELVTVARVEHTTATFIYVDGPGGLRRFRWSA